MTLRLLRMALQQRKKGNHAPIRYLRNRLIYGLTHWRCSKCSRWKGPTGKRLCEACAVASLLKALFESSDYRLDREGTDGE